MFEQQVNVPTRYGQQPCFAACPEAPGPYPAVILYMDAPGTREELRDHARHIAKHGYFCLLPDLYYRLGTLRFDIPRRDPAMSKVIAAAMASLTIEGVMQDTDGMLQWLDAQERVKPGAVGCVGHCMSGPFAVAAAARYPRMRAAASLYGVNMVNDQPDSPHKRVAQVKGELYLAFAEHDPGVPPTVVPALKEELDRAGTKYVMETVTGTHHGYLFGVRPDHHAAAAEQTWARLFDLWERNLR